MVLICVPTSPRYGSILAAALSILEFVYLIFFFCTADFIEQKGFIALVVIFLILCIISAICLIVGVVRVRTYLKFSCNFTTDELFIIFQLNKLLITPFIVLMSLFIVSYAIVFIVMISGEHKDQTWIHFTLIGEWQWVSN